MKHFILPLLIAAPIAQADVFATTHATGSWSTHGVLTTEPCALDIKDKDTSRRIFYYTKSGETGEGCWRHDAGTILLTWADGAVRRWPVSNFKIVAARSWESVR